MASAAAAGSLRLGALHASSPSTDASEFITFTATMRLPISPRFAQGNGARDYPGHDGGMDGVREVLAGWVMRYLPPIRAVLLSFTPTPRFLHPAASFPASASPFEESSVSLKDPRRLLSSPQPTAEVREGDADAEETLRFKSLPMISGSGFTLATVEWEGVGWRPRIGMKLVGTLTLASPSHVSLLLHNLFNASIPVSHIPTTEWEFDPDCAVPPIVLERRNTAVPLKSVVDSVVRTAETATGVEGGVELEPTGDEAAADAAKKEEEEQEAALELQAEEEEEELYAERGWWMHRVTREPLGGSDGRIEFTLVHLTTTNSLLSCTGSLLADPFAPAALAALSAHRPAPDANASLIKSSVLSKKKRARHSDSSSSSGSSDDDSGSDADSDSDGDVDNDDDDGVGTGIPRHGADAGGKVPRVRAASEASSRSPSPLPAPAPAEVGKDKREGRKAGGKEDKKGATTGRKAKKVKVER